MQPPRTDPLETALLRRGVPATYAERLAGEIADHREDLILDLVGQGHSPEAAAREADRRIGDPGAVAEAAVHHLRPHSFVGRHRVLVLGLAPALALPFVWAALLLPAAWAAGILSPTFEVGTASPRAGAVLLAACALCGYAAPAAAAAAFYALARRSFCGAAWAALPCFVLAALSSLTFLTVVVGGPGPAAGRLIIGAAPSPDPARLLIPLGAFAVLESLRLRRCRARVS